MKIIMPLTINSDPIFGEYYRKSKPGSKFAALVHSIAIRVYWRSKLSEAQNHKCCWCGLLTTDRRDLPNSSTIEHIQPKSLGGEDTLDNMAMSCHKCNQRRRTKTSDEFMLELASGNPVPPKDWKGRGPSTKYTKEQFIEFRKYGIRTSSASTPGRIEKRNQQLLIRKAFQESPVNPFEIDSKNWKAFNRYKSFCNKQPINALT